MDRYPILIYLGSAILGKVSAEMILTDAFVADGCLDRSASLCSPARSWLSRS